MSWDTVSLGSVAEVFNGKTPSKAEKRSEGRPVLKIKDVDESGNFRGFDSFVEPAFHEKYSKKAVRAGDTLVLNAAHSATHVGSKICRAPKEAVGALATGEWLMIRCNAETDPRFVNHWMTSDLARRQIRDAVKGIHLYPKDVARFSIPLPPLEEQQRIAGMLDAADALRRRRREALALLDTLPGAIFAEMFGDIAGLPSVPFGKVIHDIGNGVSPSRAGTVEDEVLTLSAVTGVSFDASKRKKDKFAGDIPARKRVETGDFLLCRGNGNPDLVGSAKLADNTGQGFVYPDTIMRAKLNETRVVPGYVASLWKHTHVRDQITAGARTTNGTMKINQTTVKNIEIPLPDLASQAEFARRASEIDTGIKAQQIAHLSELETLFASLQSRAFAGEL